MARGKERQIICAACKRYCRRDKAVYIEKVVFSNPIERKDVVDPEEYRAVFKREVAYCPGCGKHLRVYEKKKRENERRREREMERTSRPPQDRFKSRTGGYREVSQETPSEAPETSEATAPAQPAKEEQQSA